MNEYQDQDMWFRAEFENDTHDGWAFLGDYNSRQEAQWAMDTFLATYYPNQGRKFKINRTYGLAEH